MDRPGHSIGGWSPGMIHPGPSIWGGSEGAGGLLKVRGPKVGTEGQKALCRGGYEMMVVSVGENECIVLGCGQEWLR